jgi:hypothetical protein
VPGDRKPGESCAEVQEQSAGVANRDRGPTSHLRQHMSQKALIRLHMNRAGTGTVAILGSALSLLICVEAAALNPFVVWARKAAIHVKGTDPEQSLDDLQPVRKIIGHAHLVAAGESRHDLHEQIQFKLRLIQFLVQQMNFSGIAMEVSMPDAARVDDYVFRGRGDAGDSCMIALATGMLGTRRKSWRSFNGSGSIMPIPHTDPECTSMAST